MWPRTSGPGASKPPPLPTGREDTADASLCASPSPLLYPEKLSRLQPTPAMSSLGLPPRFTLCIKGLPPTVDNSQSLLPYVPVEGLIALRVKRCGGRDVGFAEYDSGKSAHEALQWFYRLKVTTSITYSCLLHIPASCDIPPLGYRFPVPYVEYNNYIGNSSRIMELLLRSVILEAEWSDSSPTCRPSFVTSRTPPNLYFDNQQQSYGCMPLRNMTPEHVSRPPQIGFNFTSAPHISPAPESRPHSAVAGLQNVSWGSRPKSDGCSHSLCVESVWGHGSMSHPSNVVMPVQSKARHQRQQWQSNPQQARGQAATEGGAHVYVTSSLARGESPRACLSDSTLPSFSLDDLDLPSSTLFVRALRYRRQQPQESSLPFHADSSCSISGRTAEEMMETSCECGTSLPSEQQQRKELHQRKHESNRFFRECSSCLHHHHRLCSSPEVHSKAPSSIPCDSSSRCGIPAEAQEASPGYFLLSSSHAEDDAMANEVIKRVLNRDFFSERFAGFCSYKSFGKRCGFVRFETSEDARQCLCCLRRQQKLRLFISVQFARQDTKSYCFHKRRN